MTTFVVVRKSVYFGNESTKLLVLSYRRTLTTLLTPTDQTVIMYTCLKANRCVKTFI